jgi:hypothetical protein
MVASIPNIIRYFNLHQSLKPSVFKGFLIENNKDLRNDLLNYCKSNSTIEFVRYLLKRAIEERKKGAIRVYIEDLSLFSYLLTQYYQAEDILLIWSAKRADFDTWCGMDGELLSYLGVQATEDYLSQIETKEAEEALEHVRAYKQEDIDLYFSQTHYYL